MIGKGKIKIHASIILAFIVFAILGYLKEFLVLILFVTVHEFTHIITGIAMGAKFEEILITPVGERAIIRNTEMLPLHKRVLIILSGPSASILMGIFIKIYFNTDNYIINFAADANLYIGIFNLMPFLPLDGGCAILQIAGKRYGVLKSAACIIKASKLFGIAIIILGVVQVILFPFNLSLLIIGIYFMGDNKREYISTAFRFYRNIMKSKYGPPCGRCIGVKEIMVNKDEGIGRVLREMSLDYYYIICYIEKGEIIKIDQSKVVKAAMEKGMGTKMKSLQQFL